MRSVRMLKLFSVAGMALALAGCVSSAPQDNGSAPAARSSSQVYGINDYNRLVSPYSLIPAGTDLQYLRLTHLMEGTDKVCVLNSGDFTDGRYVVRNSGTYVQRSIGDNLTQHGTPVTLLSGNDASAVQETARARGCNIIAATRLLSWQHNSEGHAYIAVRIDMFDTSSLSTLNSVRLMATADSDAILYDESKGVLKPLIATYIHKLYQN
ncbi:MAG TPA: hypothetical protein IAB18_01315 [Candidatus Avisuccinivibrio pullicola]|nr:hypothetical protein [Candidatus Avisuccinivibrio pullicola]